MKTLHAHVTPTSKMLLPTEQLAVGDVLIITMMEHTPGLRAQLQADAVNQNKALAIVDETPHKVVVVCLRSKTQVWSGALMNMRAANVINYKNGTLGLEDMALGQKIEVISFAKHPYFACKPVNVVSIRVVASKRGLRMSRKFKVSKTETGAAVFRVA